MFCRASEYPASLNFSVFYHYVALNAAFLLLIGFKSPCIIIEIEWKEKVLRLGKKKIRNVHNIIYVNQMAILCLDKSHMSH